MDKPRDIEFGKRMKAARERKGLTQKQLAEEFGLSERAVQFYEQGRSKPPATKLAAIASFLNVTSDELLNGKAAKTSDYSEKTDDVAFFEWVQEHVTGMQFYDFQKAMEDQSWLKGLRLIYEKEKGRKPGQKQGE